MLHLLSNLEPSPKRSSIHQIYYCEHKKKTASVGCPRGGPTDPWLTKIASWV